MGMEHFVRTQTDSGMPGSRQKFTDADTNHHAENHPHGQILLECADSALFFAHKSPPKIYKFKCIDM